MLKDFGMKRWILFVAGQVIVTRRRERPLSCLARNDDAQLEMAIARCRYVVASNELPASNDTFERSRPKQQVWELFYSRRESRWKRVRGNENIRGIGINASETNIIRPVLAFRWRLNDWRHLVNDSVDDDCFGLFICICFPNKKKTLYSILIRKCDQTGKVTYRRRKGAQVVHYWQDCLNCDIENGKILGLKWKVSFLTSLFQLGSW